ncbi:MAG TPA: RNA polymerase sigma factor [Acidimicrobiales bacterium]|jgi:RNA polymerase sigma-70 factor (ECF subfamily)
MMEAAPAIRNPRTDAQAIEPQVADAAAFTVIFERHFAAVFTYLARRVGVSEAEDLASQAFVIAFERRSRYEPHPSGVLPWLYGIATNLVANHRRSEMRALRVMARQHPIDASAVDVDVERMFERAGAESEYQQLVLALADLSDELRDTIVLFAWADLSYDEISAALGIAPGTVGSRISRARQILAQTIQHQRSEPPNGGMSRD